MTVSLRQLEYLVALSRTLRFREAAERCHVTQPALSTQIQQLERSLGVPLFERDRRTVALTEAGRRAVVRAERVLTEVEALTEEARAQHKPLTGTLRLGVIPTIAPYVLPTFVPALKRRYPKLRLLLHEGQTAHLLEQLRANELDLLLLALEADLGDVEVMPLYPDPFVVAAPKGHPLASRRAIRSSDLADVEVLLLDDGHCLRNQALDLCNRAGAHEVDDFRASSLNTLARMVAAGTGVTLLPSIALSTEVRARDPMVVRPFAKGGPKRTIGLAWRKTSSRVRDFELVAQLLRDRAPST